MRKLPLLRVALPGICHLLSGNSINRLKPNGETGFLPVLSFVIRWRLMMKNEK